MRTSLTEDSPKHQWPFILFAVGLLSVCAAAAGWLFILRPSAPAPRPAWNFPTPAVERVKAPLPPRFSGPLPQRLEDFWEQVEKGPPLSYVRAMLLEREPRIQEQYLAALRQQAPRAESFAALWDTYGQVIWPCSQGNFSETRDYIFTDEDWEPPCEFLVERVAQLDSERWRVRHLLWSGLRLCRGPEVEALLAREDAPLDWVFDQHASFGGKRLTLALENAVRRILRDDLQKYFTRAEARLMKMQEPSARALAGELERQARGEVAEALRKSVADRQREEQFDERYCGSIPTHAEGLEYLRVRVCLSRWVRANWPAIARLAPALADDPGYSPNDRDELATLEHFSSLAERDAWAREQGLLPPLSPESEDPSEDLSLFWRLRQAGRAFYFSFRPYLGGPSTRHDELLVTLAWKVRPELRGVVFEEVPEKRDAVSGTPLGNSMLYAYADAERFSIEAQPPREQWQDLDAALALLNHVLQARGSSTRFAIVEYGGPAAAVVFGPGPALLRAHELGLWRLSEARTAVSTRTLADTLVEGMQGNQPQALP